MILVFGGQGQLGKALGVLARARSRPLLGLGHGDADIGDESSVAAAIDRHRPTLIVNAAAYNAVDKAESEPRVAERVNALGPSVLAAAGKARGIPLIHVSTDYVFDGTKPGAYIETDPVAPLSTYGRSKERGESGVRSGTGEHLILRTAWLFGPHGDNFLTMVLRLAAERESLAFVDDQRGSPTAAADLAEAILIAADAIAGGVKVQWGTYHVAGNREATRYQFASRIVAAQASFTGKAPTVTRTSSAAFGAAAARPAQSVLDSAKFAEAFGFRPGNWETAVEQAVAEVFAGWAA